jgi:AraC-like DNA-binding protein
MAVECALPDAALDLYFNLGPFGRRIFSGSAGRQPAHRAAWVVGPRAHNLLIEKETRDCDMVGVRLRPGVASRLLGVSARELHGQMVDLENFWGSSVETLRARLAEAVEAAERFRIVNEAIAQRVGHACGRDFERTQAMCAALVQPQTTIASVSVQFGLSHRAMIRHFEESSGLKPRMFRRIQRLRRTLRTIRCAGVPAWARIAVECGFYDQAHLINEFRELTGFTPADYATRRSNAGDGFMPFLLASARSAWSRTSNTGAAAQVQIAGLDHPR